MPPRAPMIPASRIERALDEWKAAFSTSMIRFCIFLAGNSRVVLAEPVFMLVRRPFAEGRTSKSVEGLASILASGSRLLTSCLNLFGSGFAGLG